MNGRSQATGGSGTPTGAALFRQAQAGCRDSLARLMATHEKLVHAVLHKQVLGDLPFAEALQTGRIGLWHAIPSTPLRASLGFDPQRGTAFSTYAWTCIMHRVWREVKLAERAQDQAGNHLPLSEAASSRGEDGDPACAWAALAVSSALWDLITRLPERLRIVVLARYGLTGQPQVFYAQIGAGLSLSGERAPFASDSLSRGSQQQAVPNIETGHCFGTNGALRSDKQPLCHISTKTDMEPLAPNKLDPARTRLTSRSRHAIL